MIEPDGVVAAQGEQTVYAVFEAPQDGAFRVGLVGRPTVLIWTILRCGISTMRVRLIAALTWRSPVRERVRSFAIITTTPNELCAEIHNRMPVVLEPAAWPTWLGEEPADAPHLKALLAPYPSEEMVAWPVSPRVGNVKNNDPSLIEPIAGAG